jgi:hypothetical protein
MGLRLFAGAAPFVLSLMLLVDGAAPLVVKSKKLKSNKVKE